MAIQNRRGSYVDFVPSRLVPGEFAVVQSNDPNASDGKALYLCISSGVVKRIATTDDIRNVLYANLQDLSDELIEQFSQEAQEFVDDAVDAAERAESAAEDAEAAANNTVRYDITQDKTDVQKARARANIGVHELDTTLTQRACAADAKAVGDAISDITIEVDDTLTQEGMAADAKAVGDALNSITITCTDENNDGNIVIS